MLVDVYGQSKPERAAITKALTCLDPSWNLLQE
jgi:hypothetical protein